MGHGYDVFAANDAIEAYVVAAAQEMGPDIEGEVRRLMVTRPRRRRPTPRATGRPNRPRGGEGGPPSPRPRPRPRLGDDTAASCRGPHG